MDLLTDLLGFLPRGIPAETLTTLLSTLSALFKYLLVPSVNHSDPPSNADADAPQDQNHEKEAEMDLLSKTWSLLLKTLPRHNPEIQRAVGELWGVGVLRRLKGVERERAVGMLLEGEDSGEVAAWSIAFACQVCFDAYLWEHLLTLCLSSFHFLWVVCFFDSRYHKLSTHARPQYSPLS
jgi:U3 small nucleolar RNA-associated protein 20